MARKRRVGRPRKGRRRAGGNTAKVMSVIKGLAKGVKAVGLGTQLRGLRNKAYAKGMSKM